MQDDMLFIEEFKKEVETMCNNLPKDAEIINIGFHKHAVYAKVIPFDLEEENVMHIDMKVNDYVCKVKPDFNPCSSCYNSKEITIYHLFGSMNTKLQNLYIFGDTLQLFAYL